MATNMLHTFLGIKRKAEKDADNRENSCQKTCENNENESPSSASPTSKYSRNCDKWQISWEKTYSWLEKVEKDGQVHAIYTWCRDSKRNTAMVITGSSNLQVLTFSWHEDVYVMEHLWAVQVHKMKQSRTSVLQIAEKTADKGQDEIDECKDAQIRTLYCLGKYGQPLNQYENLITLEAKNKCPDLENKSKIYSSEESKSEMLDAVNETVEGMVLSDINASTFIGLIIDESTSITIHKKLNVYVKCLSFLDNEPIYPFLDCVSVVD